MYLSLTFYSHFLQAFLVDELWEIVSVVLTFLGFFINCLALFHLQFSSVLQKHLPFFFLLFSFLSLV